MPNNIKAVLCWLLGIIGGIVFLVTEKENDFIRLHAAQSVVTWVIFFLISFALVWIEIPFAGLTLNVVIVAITIIGIVKAYHNESYEFLIIGNIARTTILKK